MSKKGIDENTPVVETTKPKGLSWNHDMDYYFIHAMLDQQEQGNKVDGTFITQAYANMVDVLSKQLKRPDLNKAHLKNRLKTMKSNFAQCYDIFLGVALSGFSWDDHTKLIQAEDEVWAELIKKNHEAIKWKATPIHHANELLQLFAKDRATGYAAEKTKEKITRMNKQEDIKIETIDDVDHLIATNEVTLENVNISDDLQEVSSMPFSPTQPPSANMSKGKKRKVQEEDTLDSNLMRSVQVVADAIRESNDVLKESNSILERAYPRVLTGDEIFKGLEAMDLEPDMLANALLYLANNQNNANLLFSTPPLI